MNLGLKIHLPSVFWVLTIFYLYWAYWKEFSFSEMLYYAGVVVLFICAMLQFSKRIWKSSLFQELGFLSIWCMLMFFAYNYSNYSEVLKRVSFFGFNVDTHSRIMLFLFLMLIPGIILSESYKYTSGRVFKVIVFAIVVTSLFYSVRAVLVFPNALRARSTTEYLGFEGILHGTPTYSIVYSMSIIAPWFLVKWADTKGRSRLFYATMFISICIMVAISQFATALLALILGVAVYWLMSGKNSENAMIRVIAIAVLVLILIVRTPLAVFFNFLAEFVPGAWADKLSEIATFLGGDGASGDLATRSNLYSDSLDAFFASPIFGMIFANDTGIHGGHSTMLDMLALVGIFGTIFFVSAVFLSYKRTKALAQSSKYVAAANAVMVSYIFLACTKNLISALAVNYTFFVLIPLLFAMKESPENE